MRGHCGNVLSGNNPRINATLRTSESFNPEGLTGDKWTLPAIRKAYGRSTKTL
jgi:hypothetical protein